MAIDLDKLERLHAEAAGTPYKAKGDWIYAQSVSHKRTFSRRPMAYTIDNRDGRYKPTETATYIVAACNFGLTITPHLSGLCRNWNPSLKSTMKKNDSNGRETEMPCNTSSGILKLSGKEEFGTAYIQFFSARRIPTAISKQR